MPDYKLLGGSKCELEAKLLTTPLPLPLRCNAGMESRDLLAYLTGLGAGVREITAGENSANYMMEGGCCRLFCTSY